MKRLSTLFLQIPTAAFLLSVAAVGQANDSCAGTAIAGTGIFSFDAAASNATDSTVIPACGGQAPNGRDLFWSWTCPATANYSFETLANEPTLGTDTVMALYDNTACDGSGCIGYNDDIDGSTTATWNSRVTSSGDLVAGQVYVIQVGAHPSSSGQVSSNALVITNNGPTAPFGNDDCPGTLISGTGSFGFHPDSNTATDGVMNGACATQPSNTRDLYWVWTCPATRNYSIETLPNAPGMGIDTVMALYQGTACQSTDCIGYNDDINSADPSQWNSRITANLMGGVQYVIQVGTWGPFTANHTPTNRLIITDNAGGGVVPFCDPNEVNCGGSSTTLMGSFGSGVGSDLHLTAANGTGGAFGYFLTSKGMSDPGLMLSNGRFCLSDGTNSIGRYNVAGVLNSVGQFSADGSTFNNLVGTGTSAGNTGFDVPTFAPIPGSPVLSGETWNFQLWHRDACNGVGESNFSNAVSVLFP